MVTRIISSNEEKKPRKKAVKKPKKIVNNFPETSKRSRSSKTIADHIRKKDISIKRIQKQIDTTQTNTKQLKAQRKQLKKQELIKNKPKKPITPSPNPFEPYVPDNWEELGLSIEHCKFIIAYLTNDYNHTLAYSAVYTKCKKSSARVLGTKLLQNVTVKHVIKTFLSTALGGDKLIAEYKNIQKYKAMAYYNPKTFINLDGTPRYKKWSEIPEELQCCIEGIEVKSFGIGKHREERVIIKLADRMKSLDKLDKYINLFTNKLELTGKDGGPIRVKNEELNLEDLTDDELDELISQRTDNTTD